MPVKRMIGRKAHEIVPSETSTNFSKPSIGGGSSSSPPPAHATTAEPARGRARWREPARKFELARKFERVSARAVR